MSRRSASSLLVVLAGALTLGACDGCSKKEDKPKSSPTRAPIDQCLTPSDCSDESPCTEEDCRDSRCVVSYVPAGTSCENDTICDGVSKCDGKGRCLTSQPPDVDDGNPCTNDSCDAVQGAVHQPVAVDDSDACTKDSCDPKTGQVLHEPVEIDDGNDCTFDSCDPRIGVKHQQPNPMYKCDACGEGFHAASRTPSRQCGSATALQSFCVPDCGPSFYSCDASCPKGYQEKSRAPNGQCGAREAIMLFCLKG